MTNNRLIMKEMQASRAILLGQLGARDWLRSLMIGMGPPAGSGSLVECGSPMLLHVEMGPELAHADGYFFGAAIGVGAGGVVLVLSPARFRRRRCGENRKAKVKLFVKPRVEG